MLNKIKHQGARGISTNAMGAQEIKKERKKERKRE